MVKNTKGGSKSKGIARKNLADSSTHVALRTSQDPAEVYAQVTKIFGGSMCQVVTTDGEQMLCHIRGKFRGRGKRDNFIGLHTWLLVGKREWETVAADKLPNCDVIEVYSDQDKNKLRNTVTSVNWTLFVTNDIRTAGNAASASIVEDDTYGFADEKTQEYQEMIQQQADARKAGRAVEVIQTEDGEEVDVDDI